MTACGHDLRNDMEILQEMQGFPDARHTARKSGNLVFQAITTLLEAIGLIHRIESKDIEQIVCQSLCTTL